MRIKKHLCENISLTDFTVGVHFFWEEYDIAEYSILAASPKDAARQALNLFLAYAKNPTAAERFKQLQEWAKGDAAEINNQCFIDVFDTSINPDLDPEAPEGAWTFEIFTDLGFSSTQLFNNDVITTGTKGRAAVNIKSKYVAVYDYEGERYLEEVYIVGWSSRNDWFADVGGDEILTPSGNLKKCVNGLIDVGRSTDAYVCDSLKECREITDDAIAEGYNCTVCEIKKDSEGDWILIKVDDKEHNLEESFMKIHERKSTAKKLTYYWIFEDGDTSVDAKSPKAYNEALKEILAHIKNLTPAQKEGFGLTWDWYEGEDAEGSLILWVRSKEECEDEGISLSERVEAESGHEEAAAAIIKALSDLPEKNSTKYFYVICKMYGKIIAHGDIEVDLTRLSAYETAADRAMTDYFDGTEIAYSGEYDDENGEFDWDALERFVIEIDKNEALPRTDEEAEKFLQNAEIALEESFIKLHERKSTAKNKNLTEVYKILDKYGRVDEDVDKVFRRAPLIEQRKMVKLLKEGRVDKDAADIAKLRIEKRFPNVNVCIDGVDRDVLLIPEQGYLDFNTVNEIVNYVGDLNIKGKKFAVEMYTQDKDNPDEVVGLGQCNLSRGELLKAEWYCVADIVDKNEYYGK